MHRKPTPFNNIIYAFSVFFVLFTPSVCAQDGSLDPTFSSGFLNAAIVASALQSDGKIIIAGAWTLGEELTVQGLTRLHSDGSIDESFNTITSGLSTSSVRQIIIQEDDKILIAGVFIMLNGVPRRYIARLHPNGQIDESFDPGESIDGGGAFGNSIEAMALQPDGKIVLGGKFSLYNSQPVANGVIRINADGSLDNTFDAAPAFGPDMVSNNFLGIDIQSDGKIILGGVFDYGEGAYGDDISGLVRLNTDGSFDNTFNTLNMQDKEVMNVRTVAVDALDNIYVVGQLWGFSPQFIYQELTTRFKLEPDGLVNENHLNNVYFQSAFSSYNMALLSDWKVIYSGYYNNPFGNDYDGVLRSLHSGMLDYNFNNETPVPTLNSTEFLEQPDGKILCYGGGGNYNGSNVVGIWRIENTPEPPCGVTFEVFPDSFDSNTLLVVPEYEGFPDLEYSWSFGDGNTSDQMFPSYTYAEDGEYELCATITAFENGSAFCRETFCSEVSDDMTSGLIGNVAHSKRANGFSINVIHPNSVGIFETSQAKTFEIFPNPSRGEIFLRATSPHVNRFNVEVINTTGKIVKEKLCSPGQGNASICAIDLSNQPAGIYLVKITADQFQEVHQVVVR